MTLSQRAAAIARDRFLGVPLACFEEAGREQLSRLLLAGLNPDSAVLEFGCGVLRGAYWLIHFLEPGRYYGIEPHPERLRLGTDVILEPDVLATKRPAFDANDRFDSSVFGVKFDFFFAYSVWTHASKRQIGLMLDSFVRDSTERAAFLATYLPATLAHRDYKGDRWFGTSHESGTPGCIFHRSRWIEHACGSRGLTVEKLGRDAVHGQTWLKIARAAQGTAGTRGGLTMAGVRRVLRRAAWSLVPSRHT